jgi:hypothetical protein
VLHLGRTGQNYFYAMEFVEGETLQLPLTEEFMISAPEMIASIFVEQMQQEH